MKIKKINREVLYSKELITKVNSRDINFLKKLSYKNKYNKLRLCVHKTTRDDLHEMLIIHGKNYYVTPHKHVHKTESFHIISGKVDLVFFDKLGKIKNLISMGDFKSGLNFYYRLPRNIFHTLLIKSKILIFHEITNGPFRKNDCILAPWSPDQKNKKEVEIYLKNLKKKIKRII